MATGRGIAFVRTQITLIESMANREADEHLWNRFFDLYYSAMVKYAEMFCASHDAEDIVQRVLVTLGGILKSGRYERRPGVRFRSYLMTLIRHEFIDWRREETARGLGAKVPLLEGAAFSVQPDAAARIDAEWRIATRAAAVERVLTSMAMPDAMRRAYRAYVIEGHPPDEVAKALGVRRGYVLQAKSRIDARVRAVEAMYGE